MKRFVLIVCGLLLLISTYSFAAQQVIQFKNGDIVEGDLVKQNDVQITIKLESGKEISYYKILIAKIEPGTDYHNRLGDDFYKKDKYADAIKEYEKVLQIDSKNEHAQKQISTIDNWYKSQNAEKKSKQNEIAAALLMSEGMTYYRNTNFELAAKQFQEVLKYNPNDEQAKHYLALSNQKAQEQQAQQIQNEKEQIQTEKSVKELALEDIRKKQASLPVSPAPTVSGEAGFVAAGSLPNIVLYSIMSSGDDATAILHVTSDVQDRELRLRKNDSERVGNYRIRVTDINMTRNEVTLELIPAGSSIGQRITLTPTPIN